MRKVMAILVSALALAASLARADEPLVFILKFGSAGGGPGQFRNAQGITTDAAGNVFVADGDRKVILKFDGSGQFLAEFGGPGSGHGRFSAPEDVSVDPSGQIYVVDSGNGLMQVLASDGTFVRQWPYERIGRCAALDPTGAHIVTAVGDSARVFRASDGALLTAFAFSSHVSSFIGCLGIGPSGTIYIGPSGENAVKRYSLLGTPLGEWGLADPAPNQLLGILGLTVDGEENVYVFDTNARIDKFSADGGFLEQFGSQGTGDGQFFSYRDMAADGFGNLFVVDAFLPRITKFGPATTNAHRTSWGALKTRYR